MQTDFRCQQDQGSLGFVVVIVDWVVRTQSTITTL
jgi:hypothetical protein